MYGIRKFHQYLYRHKFVLVTDHKPFTTVLGSKKSIPPLAAARLQKWALLLSAYSYEIKWKPTREHANADGLSRLPLPCGKPECLSTSADAAFVIGQVQALPVTAERFETATRQDSLLSKVHLYVRELRQIKAWDMSFLHWIHVFIKISNVYRNVKGQMKLDLCIGEALSYTHITIETTFVGVAINYH